jgi:hypothetical protein
MLRLARNIEDICLRMNDSVIEDSILYLKPDMNKFTSLNPLYIMMFNSYWFHFFVFDTNEILKQHSIACDLLSLKCVCV